MCAAVPRNRRVPLLLALAGRFAAAPGNAVSVLLAEGAGVVLGEGVAVPLAVGRAHERRDDLEVPLADVGRLPPEVGKPEVDVQLEQIDARWSLGHDVSVDKGSDDTDLGPRREPTARRNLTAPCGNCVARKLVLRSPPILALLASVVISSTGSLMTAPALPWFVLASSGSALHAAFVVGQRFSPMRFSAFPPAASPPGSARAGRCSRATSPARRPWG